jgi:hypothetical protein
MQEWREWQRGRRRSLSHHLNSSCICISTPASRSLTFTFLYLCNQNARLLLFDFSPVVVMTSDAVVVV